MQISKDLKQLHSLQAIPRAAGFPLVGSIADVIRHQGDYFLKAWKEYGDIYLLNLDC